MRRAILVTIAALVAVGLATPATAGAATAGGVTAGAARPWHEDYISLRSNGPGPVNSDRIHVLRTGRTAASQVLVLVPGQFAAAGEFHTLARELAHRLPDTQVWAVDRRETNLEDPTGFLTGDPDQAAAYYLGGHYRTTTAHSAPYVADWGLTTTLNDLRQVVLAAHDGGHRRVILGGHSWGGSTALAYAAWDFHGHPGYQDLSGLVLIDSGVHDAFAGEGDIYRVTAEQARAGLAEIAGGTVFDPSVTMGRPETFQIDQQLAAMYARTAPNGPSTLAAQLPAPVRPTGPVTNAGLLSWLYVEHPLVPDLSINPKYTSVKALAEMNAGPVPGPLEVVLAAAVDARPVRRGRVHPYAGDRRTRAAAVALPADRRTAVLLRIRTDPRHRQPGRALAGPPLAHTVRDLRRGRRDDTRRPDLGRAGPQPDAR